MTRKLDYAYWQKRFREADDAELKRVNDDFYEEIGYKVWPLKVWDPINKKPIIHKLNHNKDEIVKRMILSKNRGESVLIVGFYDTQFAFNMGLDASFNVDGVDIKTDSVDAANESVKTLPDEVAQKFNFYCMYAEDLTGLPKYDFIVNFCLEHVRNPQRVMAENLRHLNEGGHAYFTPPLRWGTNSPSHIHYFPHESDLRALLPPGYDANVHRVKFNAESPRDNCFVMEVFRKNG